jgi:hypothetical protein
MQLNRLFTAPRARRRNRAMLSVTGMALLAAVVTASPARAAFGFAEFDGAVLNADGTAATQAAAHPYSASTTIRFNSHSGDAGRLPDADAKTIAVDLPPGFIGDPSASTKCRLPDLAVDRCPDASQVGVVDVNDGSVITGVYNIVPPPGTPARFGFLVASEAVLLDASIRTGDDYGITVVGRNTSQGIPIEAIKLTLWGVPAHPSHDDERGRHPVFGLPCARAKVLGEPFTPCSNSAGIEPRPFLTNPTACTPPGLGLLTRVRADSWQAPGVFATASFFSHFPAPNQDTQVGPTDCDRVPFEPEIEVTPHSTQPDAPSGYSVDVRFPQNDSPSGLAQAHLKRAVVTLPEGVTMNPAGADGLQGCSNAQIALTSSAEPACPESSRIGEVSVETALLEDPMVGTIYVGTQEPSDRYRIFVVAKGPGVIIKLKGSVRPDPRTGRLTTTFDNNPQLPFDRFHLEFKGGPRAPLANPPTCGTKTVTAELVPWSGNPPVTRTDSFTIDCPGLGGFAPSISAGTLDPSAGGFSPFGLRVNRPDRQQYIQGVTMEFPTGLIARLKDVPLCPDAQAGAGTCGVESRVGTATVGAGAGAPFYLQGSVYLTGPYTPRGAVGGPTAPYGLAVVVRAVAGPFDLGTVVVRQAIFVDPTDAHVTVVSDPLPVILEGIPLRLRSINVDIDRPGFMMNPTSCREKEITTTLTSTEGSVHEAAQRFQAGDCQALRLRPRLTLRLTGRRQVAEGRHPGLRAVLTQGGGQANLRRVSVKLPLSLALDPDNSQSDALCEFEAGQRIDCPASSIIGRAKAITPVLKRPLVGPVYFVKNVRRHPRTGRLVRTLPTLLIPLRGEVALNLRATTRVERDKLVNTFPAIPDAPVSRFELVLKGGRKGILVSNRHLCSRQNVAVIEIDGQNGKRADAVRRMKTPCKRGRSGGRSSVGRKTVSRKLGARRGW